MLARELLAKVRKIEIRTRRIVDELTGGAYRSVFKGRGIEFSEVREYIPGDDVRDIDWNVTARTAVPHIKKFTEERELTVILAVDVSASSSFGSRGVEKKERMAEAAALLALSAIRNHDKAGMLLFSDKNELYLPPRSGRTHVLRIIREMLGCEPEHRGTDIRAALASLAGSLKKRAVVFFISDFAAEPDYLRELTVLSRKHDLILIRITDPLERGLPRIPAIRVRDAESGAVLHVGFPTRRSRERLAETESFLAEKIRGIARHAEADMIELDVSDDLVSPLMAFFRKRAARNR